MYFKPQRKTTTNLDYHIWQSYPSESKKKMKTFQDMDTLEEFMTTKPALQKILKGILQTNRKGR